MHRSASPRELPALITLLMACTCVQGGGRAQFGKSHRAACLAKLALLAEQPGGLRPPSQQVCRRHAPRPVRNRGPNGGVHNAHFMELPSVM
jgi:hypothetical protein